MTLPAEWYPFDLACFFSIQFVAHQFETLFTRSLLNRWNVQVDLSTLQPQELDNIAKQMKEDIQLLTNNYQGLKVLQTRFRASRSALEELKKAEDTRTSCCFAKKALFVLYVAALHCSRGGNAIAT